jgi:prephenate dehydrogenase
MIERLTVIGVGLIGGSLARALRDARAVREVTGFGRSLSNLELAAELGVIDRVAVSLADAVRDANVVVLATPVGAMPEMLNGIGSVLPETTVVTDVGSTKESVMAAAQSALGEKYSRFVAGHPIAGTEQSGVAAAVADLFSQRRVILTPDVDTDVEAVSKVVAMWQATGAHVMSMSAAEHDRVLAASSHLPHVLAYALVDMLVRRDDHRAIFDCVGGGFRDFTRIASSDPVMWRDICLANRQAIVAMLNQFHDNLSDTIEAIERGDGDFLLDTFTRAKHARDKIFHSLPEA